MSAAGTIPEVASLEQARAVIAEQFQKVQQLSWRVQQLEKQLFGPSSERNLSDNLSQEQVLLSLFPAPAQPAATQEVVWAATEAASEKRVRRQPAAQVP